MVVSENFEKRSFFFLSESGLRSMRKLKIVIGHFRIIRNIQRSGEFSSTRKDFAGLERERSVKFWWVGGGGSMNTALIT